MRLDERHDAHDCATPRPDSGHPCTPAAPDSGLTRQVVALALPVLLATLAPTLFGLIDLAMVGSVSTAAIAGVGIASMVVMIAGTAIATFGAGAQSIVARRAGEGALGEAGRTFDHALLLAMSLAAVATALVFTGAEPVLGSLVSSPEIREAAVSYARIASLAFPLLAIEAVVAGYATGLGRPRISVMIEFCAAGLNILLNFPLIFGFGPIPALGAAGAAAATVIAHAAGSLAALIYLRRADWREETGHLRFERMSAALFSLLARVSLPRAIQALSYISFGAFLVMIERTQPAASAEAATLALRFMELIACVAFAAGVAGGTLAGQALGAGDRRLANAIGGRAIVLGGVAATAIALVVIGAYPAMRLLGVPTADPAVWDALAVPLLIFGLTMCVEGYGTAASQILQGTGLTGWVARWDLVTGYGLFLPLAYGLLVVAGAPLSVGVLAYTAYSIVFAVGALIAFRRGDWTRVQLTAEVSALAVAPLIVRAPLPRWRIALRGQRPVSASALSAAIRAHMHREARPRGHRRTLDRSAHEYAPFRPPADPPPEPGGLLEAHRIGLRG